MVNKLVISAIFLTLASATIVHAGNAECTGSLILRSTNGTPTRTLAGEVLLKATQTPSNSEVYETIICDKNAAGAQCLKGFFYGSRHAKRDQFEFSSEFGPITGTYTDRVRNLDGSRASNWLFLDGSVAISDEKYQLTAILSCVETQ